MIRRHASPAKHSYLSKREQPGNSQPPILNIFIRRPIQQLAVRKKQKPRSLGKRTGFKDLFPWKNQFFRVSSFVLVL